MKITSFLKAPLFCKLCTLILFSCYFSISTIAQTDTIISNDSLPINQQYEKLNKKFIIDGIKDGLNVASKPLHWQKKDWIRFSAVMGGVGTLMIFDKQIKSVFLHNQNNFTSSVTNAVEPVGDFYGLLVFPAVYATGLITQNKHVKSIGLRGSKAMAITSVITLVQKILSGGNGQMLRTILTTMLYLLAKASTPLHLRRTQPLPSLWLLPLHRNFLIRNGWRPLLIPLPL